MYLVTVINNSVETVINAVSTDINAPRISGTIKQGINCIDSFTFSILPNNPGYNLIFPIKTKVKVLNTKTGKFEFIGRVLTPSNAMSSDGLISKTFVCESELAYLIDSTQVYGEYHNVTPEQYLKIMLDRHNLNREDHKKFKLGNVTVKDNNDSLYKYMSYDTTWKNINDDLLETYGGELQIRYEGDEKYLDYLTEIGTLKETEIRLGKNIKDITNDVDPTTYITRLYPLGNKLKTTDAEGNEVDSEERLTITSVNNGLEYIDDVQGIEEFGIIEGFATWDEVTDVNNLLRKGQQYLSSQRVIISNKITALDLSLIGLDIDSFEVGNYYPLKHELLDIDYNVRIIEKSIVIESPENATITLGDKQKDIKQYQLDVKKQYEKVKKENEELKNNVNKIYNYTTEEIYRVDSRVNDVMTDTSNKINDVNNEISATNQKIESVNSEIENIKNQINSTENYIFDISEKTLSSVKENITLSTTTVMQSFDIDMNNNYYYFVQRVPSTTSDLIISKMNSSNGIVGTMTLKNFGHGSNMEIEQSGNSIYIWIESDSVLDSDNVGHGTKISRIKFEDGATYTNTAGNTFDLLPGHTFLSPSIDKINNKLCIRSYYNNTRYFTVYNLNSVMSNSPVQLAQFKIIGAMEDYPLQGHEIHGNYIYLYEGVGATDITGSVAYVTVFDFKGNIKYRSKVKGFETLDFREPEGIKLKQISLTKYELYIGFASGVKGARKANIYKYTD